MSLQIIQHEHQIWDCLSQLWVKPDSMVINSKPALFITPSLYKEPCFGLCQSVARFQTYHMAIDSAVEDANRRLTNYLRSENWRGGYQFGLNAEGAKQRARLCHIFTQAAMSPQKVKK